MISGITGSEENQGNCRMYSCSNKGKQVVKECHCRKINVTTGNVSCHEKS